MHLERLRKDLVEQSPDILKRLGILEQKRLLIGEANKIVEDFRFFYDSVHPDKDDKLHASYHANVIQINLGGQELSPVGKGKYIARLKGFGRKDMMPAFNDSIREGIEPEGWTHYRSAKGFAVSFHFLSEDSDKLIANELYGPGQFRKGEWIEWQEQLNAGNPESIGIYTFEGGLPLPLLGIRTEGSLRAFNRMNKKYKETLPLLKKAAADAQLNPELVERAQQLSANKVII